MSLLSCRTFRSFSLVIGESSLVRYLIRFEKYLNFIKTQCFVYLSGFYLKFENNNTVSFIQPYLHTDISLDTVKKSLDDKIRMAFGSYFILFICKPEVHKIPGQLGRGDICIICIMSMFGVWHIRESIYKV